MVDIVLVVLLNKLMVSGDRHPADCAVVVGSELDDIMDSGLFESVGVWMILGSGVLILSG